MNDLMDDDSSYTADQHTGASTERVVAASSAENQWTTRKQIKHLHEANEELRGSVGTLTTRTNGLMDTWSGYVSNEAFRLEGLYPIANARWAYWWPRT